MSSVDLASRPVKTSLAPLSLALYAMRMRSSVVRVLAFSTKPPPLYAIFIRSSVERASNIRKPPVCKDKFQLRRNRSQVDAKPVEGARGRPTKPQARLGTAPGHLP